MPTSLAITIQSFAAAMRAAGLAPEKVEVHLLPEEWTRLAEALGQNPGEPITIEGVRFLVRYPAT
jgi:hypothetical protein